MKMENPYHTLGEAFVSSIVAGGTGKIQGKQEGLSERLRQYAYYMQENAVEAGDALLVNDLLDAAKRLTPTQTSEAHPMDAGMRRTQETMVRFTNEPQPVGVREAVIEQCAKLVEPKRPRPCDCERCDCGNSGDLEAVAAWDADAANAKAIRALSLTRPELGGEK
jgi:hypothetical protein